MKFAHLSDCHIGSWRDPHLSEMSTLAFEKAVDTCIREQVDFIVIAGDLFNTSLPSFDSLKRATKKFKELKDISIPVYLIPGSHDFSPSGKTMLDVLEEAGLVINVVKGRSADNMLELAFTVDNKTGAKITGMLGKKGGLEKEYYKKLDLKPLEEEKGYKIFIFHTLLTELKPKSLENVDSEPLSFLPKGFNYYAGGHPHFVFSEKIENYGTVAYPGPLFPNNFKELEELRYGGFFIIENDVSRWNAIKLYDVESVVIDADHKSSEEVNMLLKEEIEKQDFTDKIVTLRLLGTLESGKPSDISLADAFKLMREKGAYTILKNSSALSAKEFEETKIDVKHTENIEENLVKEHITKDDLEGMDAPDLTKRLLKTLDAVKQEGETVFTYEKRVREEIDKTIG